MPELKDLDRSNISGIPDNSIFQTSPEREIVEKEGGTGNIGLNTRNIQRWKVEIWLEDTPSDASYLTQEELIIAMVNAKEAIEETWTGLKVIDMDVHEDKEESE